MPDTTTVEPTSTQAASSTNGASSSPADAPVATVRIEQTSGWQLINLKELVAYRDLFFFLVWRDVKVLYKQTVMGFSWALIRPIFQVAVFTFIFGNLAKVSSDGVPYALFNYVAMVPWTYFQASMTSATSSLVSNKGMLTRIYFPRLIIPMTSVLAKLVDFGIGLAFVVAPMAYYGVVPTWHVLALPLLILLMMMLAAGVGMWLSALTIQYRDINHATSFIAQILMYAAPVVWPVSLITETYGETVRLLYGIYPMAGIIEGFRAALLGSTPMPWDLIGIGSISTVFLFVTGAFYFRRMERRFADVA